MNLTKQVLLDAWAVFDQRTGAPLKGRDGNLRIRLEKPSKEYLRATGVHASCTAIARQVTVTLSWPETDT